MKKKIINSVISIIRKNCDYDTVKLEEIQYGLEGLYLTLSKLIVIGVVAVLLHIEKEVLIFLCIYNIIRMPSFGLHATKSWICLVSSLSIFILVPLLADSVNIPIYLKCGLGTVLIILFYKNAPADTIKRPIINKKRREVYKFISTILTIIFCVLSIAIKNSFIANCFIFSLIVQAALISPFVYKLFHLPYNNYLRYLNEGI